MTGRLRIAIVGIRGLPPLYGGGETASDELARRLVSRGHDVLVYCRVHNSAPPRPRAYHGIRLCHLPSLHTKNLDTPTHIILSVLHLVFRERVDVVLLSGVGTWFVIPWLHLFGKKTVMWADGKDWERGKWGRFAKNYLKWSARESVKHSDAIVTDTKIAHEMYRDELGRETDYIPYGANIEPVDGNDELKRWGLSTEEYLLFVGRLIPEKGVHYLIEAFERLDTSRQLVIVGDNPYNPAYVDSLKRTSDSRILFTGYVFGEGFKQLMRNCLLYVQPSDVEGTSPVLLTAMGYARPVVVNGIPENLATVGQAGISFRPGDVDDLERILRDLIVDAGRLSELGQLSEARVRAHYDWDHIAEQFEQVFWRITRESVTRGKRVAGGSER